MRTILLILLLLQCADVASQQRSYWQVQPIAPASMPTVLARYPSADFQFFTLDLAALKADLANLNSSKTLAFPNPEGVMEAFVIEETQVMPASLAARFADIKTYSGYGLTARDATIKLDLSPSGVRGMVLGSNGNSYFLEPLEDGNYLSYRREKSAPLTPAVAFDAIARQVLARRPGVASTTVPATAAPVLRRYRLALAASGEYTRHFGGTHAALAAQVSTIHRVNAIFEREFGVSLHLVENNDKLIFPDPALDPYQVPNLEQMMTANQQAIDSIIGRDNYDLGHVFYIDSKPNGSANLGVVCQADSKARGVSGSNLPLHDQFVTNLVAHELGHQFGANHSMAGNCQSTPETAFEPGSGSSIMAYGGTCRPNIQAYNDPYFHGLALREISQYLRGAGDACGTRQATNLRRPVILPLHQGWEIPAETPFFLAAQVQSGNAYPLQYSWEQMTSNNNVPMPPRARYVDGPLFRSLPPVNTSVRIFPAWNSLLQSASPVWEVLPSASGNLIFLLSARDPAAGQHAQASTSVRFHASGQAFKLLDPESVNWQAGQPYTVRWQVGNTNSPPINCAEVDLWLLDSMGKIALPLGSYGNTGQATVSATAFPHQRGYLMLSCKDNIFFSVANSPITIEE